MRPAGTKATIALAFRAGGPLRTGALAAAPGLVNVAAGQASCVVALVSLSLTLAALVSLARGLSVGARAGGEAARGTLPLRGFLTGSGALLGCLLLSLPAPPWLGSPTPGRHAALLALSLLAAGGFALALRAPQSPPVPGGEVPPA